jgi:predicted HicB family RNase H-like nuclease
VYSFQADFQSNYKAPAPLQIEGEEAMAADALADAASHQRASQPLRPLSQVSQPALANQQMKRLSLQLSASLHREAKLAALEDEETLNSMVIGLLKQYLAQRRKMIESATQRQF